MIPLAPRATNPDRRARPHDPCILLGTLLCSSLAAGCGSGVAPAAPGPNPAPAPTLTYHALTVQSTDPAAGVGVSVSPADASGQATATTPGALRYADGTVVAITAPATAGLEQLSGFTGCAPSTAATMCTLTLTADTTVTVNYKSAVSLTLSPAVQQVTIGSGVQFTASVTGSTNTAVVWSVAAPAGSALSPGTLTQTGSYQTPFPAPASVVVTATSVADPVASASQTLQLVAPAGTTGPALTVATGTVVRTISPQIYGMNDYGMTAGLLAAVPVPVKRWGGDATTRYNYLLDVTNAASDYYFENSLAANTAYPDASQFNTQVAQDRQYGAATIATVPLIGWTTQRKTACGFSVARYGAQKQTDPYTPDCGNGIKLDGTLITGNDPTDTSVSIDQSFVAGWVKYLVGKFGNAAAGGVAIYALDNEPEYWSGVHRDVHPKALSYDELTNSGIAYATAIKTADPTALVSGPVISNWDNYFYSWQDLVSGWSTGPCYCYNGNPSDRTAHGDKPLLAYYLQQMAAAGAQANTRLLDYLDLHTYFSAAGTAFQPAGDTALQAARLNSTRVFWDPTYTDPAYTDPENRTATAPPLPPQLIPTMRALVAANYPGTRLAFTEYNWGGQESVNGALAQAEILALFGREGLDLATLWGPPDPVKQLPGLLAFRLFANYDGQGSTFGDGSLAASSADQSKLAVYAARRSRDGALTVLVLNKSFGTLASTLSLATPASAAQVFQYSNADPANILHQPDAAVTPSAGGSGGAATVSLVYPAQSITLLRFAQ